MPDDPKAVPAGTDPTATAPAASGTDPGSNSEQETAEQKLKRENEELRKKYDDEHRLRLSHEQSVREANAARRDEGRTNATDTDPLDAEIAALESVNASLRAAGQPEDPATSSALRRVRAEKDERDRSQQVNARMAQARIDLQSIPAEHQQRAWSLWQSGRFWTVQDAYQAAKGEEADKLREQLANRETDFKKREAEILAAQASAPGSPRAGGGGGSGGGKPTKKLSDYQREVEAKRAAGDHKGAAQLVRDKDAGVFQLDYSG